jgi:hypothetical protein
MISQTSLKMCFYNFHVQGPDGAQGEASAIDDTIV